MSHCCGEACLTSCTRCDSKNASNRPEASARARFVSHLNGLRLNYNSVVTQLPPARRNRLCGGKSRLRMVLGDPASLEHLDIPQQITENSAVPTSVRATLPEPAQHQTPVAFSRCSITRSQLSARQSLFSGAPS